MRTRYGASWAGEMGRQLKALDFVNWITIFGASLLWSALPLLILLSSLANSRVDDDISRHIGLNTHGAHIVETLFRGTPARRRAHPDRISLLLQRGRRGRELASAHIR